MKINQINLPEFIFFEYFQDFLNQICLKNQNKDFVFFFDEKNIFFEFKKLVNLKNSFSHFDSKFLSKIMIKIFLFFQNGFLTKNFINFFFENQNFFSKKYKFFFNSIFNNVNFDENSLIEELLDIEFIKIEFQNIKKRILLIIKEIKIFFEKYHKKHEIKNNFIFFFLSHLILMKKFLFEFFDLKNHSIIKKEIEKFKKKILKIFTPSPLINFDIYLMIFEKEIISKKYKNFYQNKFEILNYRFCKKNYNFFCIEFSKQNLLNFENKNFLIISKNLEKNLILLENFNDKKITFFIISNEIDSNQIKNLIHFTENKKDEKIAKCLSKNIKKINSFDIFDLFFQKEKFFVSKILEKNRSNSFFEKKNDFLVEKFFEKIFLKFCATCLKKDYFLSNSKEIFEKFFQIIIEKEIFFKSDKKIGALIDYSLKNPLRILFEVFFQKIIKPSKRISFENLEFKISENFILKSKEFLFEINQICKKIEIFNFFYDESFVQKDFFEFKKKIEFILQCFLIKKKYKDFELEMNFFVFNSSSKMIKEIKFDNQILQNLILNFEEKIILHLNKILNINNEKN